MSNVSEHGDVNSVHLSLLGLCVLVALGPAKPTVAGDWPTYRHDLQRTATTDEKLTFPLKPAWRYTSARPPAPAWHAPFRYFLINLSDFDNAFAPVIADGLAFFGSSSDDSVRALDLATGQEKWHFATGGPVRVAPQIAGGRAYFGSDDGVAYCVDATTGKLVWSFRAAPFDEQMSGNGRMISRWPIRSGVMVADGVAYCVAGMWPTEGVHICAIDAATGKVIWRNDTAGRPGPVGFVDSADGGHQGEYGPQYFAPQGPMLLWRDILLVPQGCRDPMLIDRRDGLPWGGINKVGGCGTWGVIDGGRYYAKTVDKPGVFIVSSPLDSGPVTNGRIPLPRLAVTPMADTIHETGIGSAVIRKGKVLAHKAYGLALAGDILLKGEDGAVAALDPDTERELWRAAVNGQAREFAVADGRLIVSTDRGEISCFVSDKTVAAPAQPVIRDRAAELRQDVVAPTGDAAGLVERLRAAGMDRGFALVVGDQDGQLCTALANHTPLCVVSVLTDSTKAAALREKLLTTTAFHGSRIAVQCVERLDRLPFAQYFANAVIVAGLPVAASASDVPAGVGKELYRVLRPGGGLMLMPGLKPAAAEAMVKAMDSAHEKVALETPATPGMPMLVRGRLPGATDWDGGAAADRTLKWPLRPLWYGGPITQQSQGYLLPIPNVMGNGRYFVQGEDSLTAVDAYNGLVLWTRPTPRSTIVMMAIDGVLFYVDSGMSLERYDLNKTGSVDGNSFYLNLSKGCFGGRGTGTVQLDIRTGEQKRIVAPYTQPPQFSLKTPQTWTIAIDAVRSGTLTLEAAADALVVRLASKDSLVTQWDVWDLFFDFRPLESRYGLYDRGVFHIRVTPALDDNTPARWTAVSPPGSVALCPAIDLAGNRTQGGTEATVRIPWAQVQKITGAKPDGLGFAAGLVSADSNTPGRLVQRFVNGDCLAGGINNGWANVFLGDAPATVPVPAVLVSSLPRGGGVRNTLAIASGLAQSPRLHPLSGQSGPKVYRSGNWGCSGPSFSANVVFRRAGSFTLGMYDFEDDSGLRWFGGIKAGCSVPRITGMGVMILAEENGHCVCPFFRTSLALAPAEHKLQEDWALFYERDVDTLVRSAAINMGAPGDRRDDKGALWLGFPRPGDAGRGFQLAPGTTTLLPTPGKWIKHEHAALQVPMTLDVYSELGQYKVEETTRPDRRPYTVFQPYRARSGVGPYWINADVNPIRGTDRPWLYTTGFCGIKKATLRVCELPMLASQLADKPPAIDGKTDDSAWAGVPQAVLPNTKTEVRLRHDADNLYIAARRPAITDPVGKITPWNQAGKRQEPGAATLPSSEGKVTPWTKNARGNDANVWNGDSFELFVSDASGAHVLHLGVSASGARFDALSRDAKGEDSAWNGEWRSAVAADGSSLAFEIAVPWKTIEAAGLKKDALTVNFEMNQINLAAEAMRYLGGEGANWKLPGSDALISLGGLGRQRCGHFAPIGLGKTPTPAERSFTVRLHFAELDESAKPGQRVFDVKLQGQTVLKGFDIVTEAKAARTALVKEFKGVKAGEALTLEFIAAGKELTAASAPILSALEVYDEDFGIASKQLDVAKTSENRPEHKPSMAPEVFTVGGHKAFLISPARKAAGGAAPWVWYAPIQGDSDRPGGHLTWMFEKFLDAGIGIAGMNTAQPYGLYGGPVDRALFTAFYDELVRNRGLSPKPCMMAQSRGGFQVYNWAAEHPTSVACIVGIYSAYDPKGWVSYSNSPLEHLEGLAGEHVPMFNIHGDSDDRVPIEKHATELQRRYRQLGGQAALVVVKGHGHEVLPEYFQCQELVDFVIANASAGKGAAPVKR